MDLDDRHLLEVADVGNLDLDCHDVPPVAPGSRVVAGRP
jgi:hypothetical protein